MFNDTLQLTTEQRTLAIKRLEDLLAKTKQEEVDAYSQMCALEDELSVAQGELLSVKYREHFAAYRRYADLRREVHHHRVAVSRMKRVLKETQHMTVLEA